jgi:protein-L-isoaspartate O-methyltransferase
MTETLDIYLSDEFRRSVEENLGHDPRQIALSGRVPHAAEVATQVKYLGRAAEKLPSFHAARCILPPLAFEQASSEAAAARKAYSGGVAIDLTCGLGVDSLNLSRRFERVTAVERDPFLAAVARENFRRLGARNIEVVNASAEEYLSRKGVAADLIYADPDRRGADGRKLVRVEDCSPDIASLLPLLRRTAPRLVVKLSPMFDVAEVFRVFGPNTRAEVVSLGGECKEIVAETAEDISAPLVRAVAIGVGEVEYPFAEEWSAPEKPFEPELYRYLVIPDVALQKARLARRYLSERGVWIASDNGYGFATSRPENLMGRVLATSSIEPFDPKALKRRLREQGVKSIDILKRDFPLAASGIARQLSVREGGTLKIAFTRAGGRLWQITIK